MKNLFRAAGLGLVSLAFAGLASAQDVTGAGASFPAPLYAKWAADYNKATGVKINYQSVGSGAGIKPDRRQDRGLRRLRRAAEGRRAGQEGPGAVPHRDRRRDPGGQHQGHQPRPARLNGQVLGDIYLGKITKWNDAGDQGAEPRRWPCPTPPSPPVRRADGSGTSFIFTNYLSQGQRRVEGQGRRGHRRELADRRGRQGQRRRRRLRRPPAQLDRLRRVRLRQAEQDDLRADAERRRPVRRAGRQRLQGRRRRRRLVQELLPDPDQPAGRGVLADHRRHLHPDAQGAGQAGAGRRRAEVLRLGLQERRQDRRRPRLRADARRGEGADREAVGTEIKDASGKAVAFK